MYWRAPMGSVRAFSIGSTHCLAQCGCIGYRISSVSDHPRNGWERPKQAGRCPSPHPSRPFSRKRSLMLQHWQLESHICRAFAHALADNTSRQHYSPRSTARRLEAFGCAVPCCPPAGQTYQLHTQVWHVVSDGGTWPGRQPSVLRPAYACTHGDVLVFGGDCDVLPLSPPPSFQAAF